MRIDIPLGEKRPEEDDADAFESCTTDVTKAAQEFLTMHKHAKIIVIVDTHSLDRGELLWKGDSAANYEGCCLWDVGVSALSSFLSTKASPAAYRHSETRVEVPFGFRGHPAPQPPKYDNESCMWVDSQRGTISVWASSRVRGPSHAFTVGMLILSLAVGTVQMSCSLLQTGPRSSATPVDRWLNSVDSGRSHPAISTRSWQSHFLPPGHWPTGRSSLYGRMSTRCTPNYRHFSRMGGSSCVTRRVAS